MWGNIGSICEGKNHFNAPRMKKIVWKTVTKWIKWGVTEAVKVPFYNWRGQLRLHIELNHAGQRSKTEEPILFEESRNWENTEMCPSETPTGSAEVAMIFAKGPNKLCAGWMCWECVCVFGSTRNCCHIYILVFGFTKEYRTVGKLWKCVVIIFGWSGGVQGWTSFCFVCAILCWVSKNVSKKHMLLKYLMIFL